MAESPDATLLQRRARRRLVGAIALVVLVVILLPIVLDREPSPIGQDLVIQIPSQEAGRFKTPVLPPSTPGSAAPAPPSTGGAESGKTSPAPAEPEARASEPVAPDAAKHVPTAETKTFPAPQSASAREAAASPRERDQTGKGEPDGARALALLEGKEAWVVPLGAFSSVENVKQLQEKLAGAGIRSYTEIIKTAKGQQTRVRAGPFDSKAAAEKARQKLGEMGLKPAAVTAR